MEYVPKKRIITIAGRPGSGKSTVSKLLALSLSYDHFSSGDLFRAIGKERGFDLLQANYAAENESDIDHIIDQKLRDIGKNDDEKIIDSRTAWHWIPGSLKVYLHLDLRVAAERILGSMDPIRIENEHIIDDPDLYAEILRKRLESENKRYDALYGFDVTNVDNYDLVIDAQANNAEQVVKIIEEKFRSWIA